MLLDVFSRMAKERIAHALILIWLYNKITSDEIDDVICVEIPRANVDKDLHAVIIKKQSIRYGKSVAKM